MPIYQFCPILFDFIIIIIFFLGGAAKMGFAHTKQDGHGAALAPCIKNGDWVVQTNNGRTSACAIKLQIKSWFKWGISGTENWTKLNLRRGTKTGSN